jgi:polysaccharide biosynthesis protein PslG
MVDIRKVMIRAGESDKKIWITEFGAPTSGTGQRKSLNQNDGFAYGRDYISEDAQRLLIQSAANSYLLNQSWMRGFFVFSLYDTAEVSDTTSSTEAHYGLLRIDGTPKPVYEALKQTFMRAASTTAATTTSMQ